MARTRCWSVQCSDPALAGAGRAPWSLTGSMLRQGLAGVTAGSLTPDRLVCHIRAVHVCRFAELAKRNINYVQLAELLKEAYGSSESPQNLSNKIARGKFSAVFMVKVCEAIGAKSLELSKPD